RGQFLFNSFFISARGFTDELTFVTPQVEVEVLNDLHCDSASHGDHECDAIHVVDRDQDERPSRAKNVALREAEDEGEDWISEGSAQAEPNPIECSVVDQRKLIKTPRPRGSSNSKLNPGYRIWRRSSSKKSSQGYSTKGSS